jgi:ligand-binding SRPBCC domain-containing protein
MRPFINMHVMNDSAYVLHREQRIPRPIEDVFSFFANAKNLEQITPGWLGFQILSPQPIGMHPGALIRYRIRWHGLPMAWLTEIRSWNPPTEFVDVQVKGPYRLWHHTHSFIAVDGGTLMRDAVRYALPFGFVGRLAHAWRVRSDLEALFDFRAATVTDILGHSVNP